MDPKAVAILKNSSEYLSKLNGFQVHARAALKLSGLGSTEVACEKTIRAQRPNKLAILTKPVLMFRSVSVFCDGKKLHAIRQPSNKYTEQEAPKTLAAIVKGLPSTDLLGMDIEKAFLSENDADEGILKDGQSLSYLGTDKLDGITCHRLKLVNEEGQFEMWVQDGDQPVIRRIWGDMSKMLAEEDDEFLNLLFKSAARPTKSPVRPAIVRPLFKSASAGPNSPNRRFTFAIPIYPFTA